MDYTEFDDKVRLILVRIYKGNVSLVESDNRAIRELWELFQTELAKLPQEPKGENPNK